jgi:hypothetical protein
MNRRIRHFGKLFNGRKENECGTFTATSSNRISKGKTPDTIDVPTTEEIETSLKNTIRHSTHGESLKLRSLKK